MSSAHLQITKSKRAHYSVKPQLICYQNRLHILKMLWLDCTVSENRYKITKEGRNKIIYTLEFFLALQWRNINETEAWNVYSSKQLLFQ